MSLSQEEVIKEYIYQMKDIYDKLLTFIDNPDSRSEEYFQNLIHINKKHDIQGDKERFSHFIDLLVNISNDHHRQSGFFDKIERILSQYKDTIKANSTNIEIFEQFSSNKRLLYFLIKSGILIIDDNVGPIIEYKIEKNGIRYSDYFLFEIPKNDNNRVNDNEQLKYYMNHFDEYEENRKNGENDSYICSLIRNDFVEEFIKYVNQKSISLSSRIKPSIFETNSFLKDKEPSLIEYAAFFGSIQIFKYLYDGKVEVNSSLWLYGIHSNNSNFFVNYIEGINVKSDNQTFEEELKESIKCHHDDFALYIRDNLITENQKTINDKGITFNERIFDDVSKYCNYFFFPETFNENYLLHILCMYNYKYIVDLLYISRKDIIEAKIIKTNIFFFIAEFINSI